MDSAEAPDPAASQRVPARIVLASIAALWLCYFGLATLRGWLVGLGDVSEAGMIETARLIGPDNASIHMMDVRDRGGWRRARRSARCWR